MQWQEALTVVLILTYKTYIGYTRMFCFVCLNDLEFVLVYYMCFRTQEPLPEMRAQSISKTKLSLTSQLWKSYSGCTWEIAFDFSSFSSTVHIIDCLGLKL